MTYPDQQTYCRLRDGTLMALGPEDLLPDGASLVIPLQMRDQARAGGGGSADIFMTDAEQQRLLGAADASYLSMCRRLSSAWMPEAQRQAAARDGLPSQPVSAVDAQMARDTAHREMIERLTSAWRRPVG